MIHAIIFDLDGLLIDSEGSWNAIRTQIFSEYGKPWTDADHKAVMGVNTQEWANYMLRRLGSDLDPQQLVQMVVDRLSALYQKKIPFLPGAKEAIRIAGKQYPLGLASGSHHSLLKIVTSHPDLAGKFQVVSAQTMCNQANHHRIFTSKLPEKWVCPQKIACVWKIQGMAFAQEKLPE